MANTGYKSFTLLEKYYKDDGSSTGDTRPNVVTDPDYIAPVLDTVNCAPSARYYNTQQTKTVTKNNCSAGQAGTEVTLTAYTNQFVSDISVTDANNQAIAWLEENAQVYANNLGTCVVDSTPPNSSFLSVSSITSSTLTLSWTPPTEEAGITITGYDVFKDGVILGSTLSDVLTYQVNDLSESTTYNFYVIAKSSRVLINTNTVTITTLPSFINLPAVQSVIFEKQASTWDNCRNASSADLQHNDNGVIGSAYSNSTYYVNRYRGLIDTSSIPAKPKSAKIKFRFSSNTVGNSLTFNLFASTNKIPLNQAFRLSDWDDWSSSSFINSVVIPSNSTVYNEIALTNSQLELLISEQAYNFFLISNGDKDNITPSTNSRPTISTAYATGEIYLECKF